jgi:hypothetical protein
LAPVLLRGETFLAVDNLLDYLPWKTGHPGFRPRNALITDPVNGLIYPTMSVLQQGLARGTVPLWNPYILLGVPQQPQSNPLDYLAYGALPIPAAHDALLALYLAASLLFTWLFLRELGLGRTPALLGTVAWGFNPFVMVWFEYEHAPLLAATLPAMLFGVESWLRTHRAAALLGIVTAAAFSLWADFLQTLAYVWLLVGSWALVRCVARARGAAGPGGVAGSAALGWGQVMRRDLLPIAAAFALAIIFAANAFTGQLHTMVGGHRDPVPFDELHRRTGVLPWEYLRTLVFSDFYGSPLRWMFATPKPGPGYPYNNYNELCIHAGIAPLFLAAASLAWLRQREVRFFVACAALSLLMAAGSRLYQPIWLLPRFDLATPTRILFVWGFGISMLAALGLDRLLAEKGARRWFALGAGTLLVAAALAMVLQVQSDHGVFQALSRSRPLAELRPVLPMLREHFALGSSAMLQPLVLVTVSYLLIAGLVLARSGWPRAFGALALTAVAAFELVSFAAHYNTTSPRSLVYPETPALRFLRDDDSLFRVVGLGRFLHSALVPFEIQDAGGFSSFIPERTGELLLAADVPGIASSATYGLDIAPPGGVRSHADYARVGSPLLDLLNVKYVLRGPGRKPRRRPGEDPAGDPSLELVYDDEIRIFHNTAAFPRAFFVPGYQLAPDRVTAYRTLRTWNAEDFRTRVLLETPPPPAFSDLEQNSRPSLAGPAPPVEVLSHTENRVELEVSAPQRGFVVLSDAWHPAWRATVNGQPEGVLLADYALRAVPVEPGPSRISLEHRPRAALAGAAVTAAGWAVLAAAWVALLLRRRSR